MRRIQSLASLISRFELWVIAALIVAGMLAEQWLVLSVWAVAFFTCIRWAAYGTIRPRTPADWGIVLLLIILVLNMFVTPLPDLSRSQVYRLIAGIGIFYAIVSWIDSETKLNWAMRGLALIGISLAMLGLISVDWSLTKLPFIPDSVYSQLPRQVLESIHPNVLAGYLIFLLPVVGAPMVFNGMFTQKINWLYPISSVAMLVLVLLTKSRGAVLGLFAAALLLISLRWRRGRLVSIIILASAGLLLVIPQSRQVLVNALASAPDIETLALRQEIWSRGLLMVEDFPLMGGGMGMFGKLADAFYPLFSVNPDSVPHAHNLFLQVAVDLGVPGLVAFLAIFVTVGLASSKVFYGSHQTTWASMLGAGLLSSHAALFIHGMVDSVTWGMVRPAPLVWMVWGLSIAGLNLKYKR